MSQKQQKEQIQSESTPEEQEHLEADLSDYHFDESEQDVDLDIEETYLNRLKIQRKRIQELELLYRNNEDKLRKEQESNKILQQEITRLSSIKDYSSKYSIISSNLEISEEQNKRLKGQLDDLKQELIQSNSEKSQIVQKLKLQISLQRDRQNSKLEMMEEDLQAKQEQIQKMQRDFKGRERELLDTISSLKGKIDMIMSEHENNLLREERKVDKLERQLQTRSIGYNEIQSNLDALLKENSQLKEDVFRLNSYLTNREMQLKNQSEKFKVKFNSMKKDMKAKDKECQQFKDLLRKNERQNKESSTQAESLRIEIRKIKETLDIQRGRFEAENGKDKQRLQLIINQHLASIEELNNLKNELLAENKRLQSILRKKEAVQKQRKQLLKTELKEIDKLEKCIDRIVE